jgi:hypothetical protein
MSWMCSCVCKGSKPGGCGAGQHACVDCIVMLCAGVVGVRPAGVQMLQEGNTPETVCSRGGQVLLHLQSALCFFSFVG